MGSLRFFFLPLAGTLFLVNKNGIIGRPNLVVQAQLSQQKKHAVTYYCNRMQRPIVYQLFSEKTFHGIQNSAAAAFFDSASTKHCHYILQIGISVTIFV